MTIDERHAYTTVMLITAMIKKIFRVAIVAGIVVLKLMVIYSAPSKPFMKRILVVFAKINN